MTASFTPGVLQASLDDLRQSASSDLVVSLHSPEGSPPLCYACARRSLLPSLFPPKPTRITLVDFVSERSLGPASPLGALADPGERRSRRSGSEQTRACGPVAARKAAVSAFALWPFGKPGGPRRPLAAAPRARPEPGAFEADGRSTKRRGAQEGAPAPQRRARGAERRGSGLRARRGGCLCGLGRQEAPAQGGRLGDQGGQGPRLRRAAGEETNGGHRCGRGGQPQGRGAPRPVPDQGPRQQGGGGAGGGAHGRGAPSAGGRGLRRPGDGLRTAGSAGETTQPLPGGGVGAVSEIAQAARGGHRRQDRGVPQAQDGGQHLAAGAGEQERPRGAHRQPAERGDAEVAQVPAGPPDGAQHQQGHVQQPGGPRGAQPAGLLPGHPQAAGPRHHQAAAQRAAVPRGGHLRGGRPAGVPQRDALQPREERGARGGEDAAARV
eukprot:scaffold4148_cov240-Pinguiococcus_pyrenoidosus.AAC.7